MALTAGVVPELPDLACIGMVSKVGDVKLSEKGVYHVLPIEIKGKFSGKDGLYFLIFRPEWFGASFVPKSLLDMEDQKQGQTQYSFYRRVVADASKPSVLQAILGEDFEKAGAEFDAIGNDPTAEQVADVIRRYAVGKDVGYVQYQRTDEEGELMEMYNIKYFFPANDEDAVKDVMKQADNQKRKRGPLVITWDE